MDYASIVAGIPILYLAWVVNKACKEVEKRNAENAREDK